MNIPRPSQSTPLHVRLLGYAGLIPFLSSSLALAVLQHTQIGWLEIGLSYGAIILSFLGGLHWAFAMTLHELTTQQKNQRFIWSVIPSLLAWSSFALSPMNATLVLVIGFLSHLSQDFYIKKLANMPAWYLPLRMQLTAVACLCLIINYLLAHQ